ncbi:MAG: Helix-turn-helix domain [Verrucomicrobiota bacterium]|nr:Helix-turn-helix domain [Verrucomicrobiota bacterium]
MSVTLETIAARLERIEQALSMQAPARVSYTPKEFAKLVGRSYRWTVDRCAARVIRTVRVGGAYLIPASELERFSNGQKALL